MIPFRSVADASAAATAVALHLDADGVVACPTETVYGFSSAVSSGGLAALRRLKGRDPAQPFLALVSDLGMLARLGVKLDGPAKELAAAFWPGPLTLILPADAGAVPAPMVGPDGGVAVRWTSHPPLAALIALLGSAVSSTSANRTGEPVAAGAGEVASRFAREVAEGDLMILDGGDAAGTVPSTIVSCMDRDRPVVVREGAIDRDTIMRLFPGDR